METKVETLSRFFSLIDRNSGIGNGDPGLGQLDNELEAARRPL